MQFNNRLNRTLAKLKKAGFLELWLRNRAIGSVVPFVGTAGIKFKKMTCEEVIVEIPNAKKVQNHINQVHAAASVLLAETASGMVVGMNIPDDKLPLMKNLSAKFIKRSQGHQQATATLSPEQIDLIRNTEKGEVNVAVQLLDSQNQEVVLFEMVWAWLPKKK